MNDHSWTAKHLPWYVNGTLVGDELDRARNHLRGCVACRQDLGEQQRLADAIAAPTPPSGDAALALAEMHERLDAREHSRLRALFNTTPAPAKWIMAAQSVLLLLALGWFVVDRPADTAPTYRTLSSDALPAGDLRVIFAPTLDEAARRAWLAEHGARALHGPGPGGVVTVDWPTTADTALVQVLKNDPRLIFVAPAGGAP